MNPETTIANIDVRVVRSRTESLRRPLLTLLIVGACAACVLLLAATKKMETERSLLVTQRAEVEAQKRKASDAIIRKPVSPLKSSEFVIKQIAILDEIADQAGLTLSRAKAQPSNLTDEPESQIRLAYALSGSYPSIKKFVLDARKAVPGLVLVSLSIRRQAIGDATAEAEATYVLHLRKS